MNSKSGLSLKIEIYFDRSGGLSSATRFWEFSLDHSECMDHAISKLWLKPAGGTAPTEVCTLSRRSTSSVVQNFYVGPMF